MRRPYAPPTIVDHQKPTWVHVTPFAAVTSCDCAFAGPTNGAVCDHNKRGVQHSPGESCACLCHLPISGT